MSSQTATSAVTTTEQGVWKGGVVAGLAGGALMGVMLSVLMTPVIQVAIPSMYGLSGGAMGWVVHMGHSAILGVVFAGVASALPTYTDSTAKTAVVGAAYGAVLWVVLAVLVMPLWLSAVGSPANPPFPNVNVMSLVAHLVYGVVLGAIYPAVESL
jgi:uncharacterized membrane protein YagU involved in acid resistance